MNRLYMILECIKEEEEEEEEIEKIEEKIIYINKLLKGNRF